MGQIDLRAEISHANLISLQGALLMNSDKFGTLFQNPSNWAVGVEYGRKTIAGPLRLGVHWCKWAGFGATLSFGFDF